jgi:hypothetical protein
MFIAVSEGMALHVEQQQAGEKLGLHTYPWNFSYGADVRSPQDAQKARLLTHQTPARQDAPFRGRGRRRIETGGVPSGYVEDFDELRTKLADFFNILLELNLPPESPMRIDLIDDDQTQSDEEPPKPDLHPVGTGSRVGDSQAVGWIIRRN